MIKSMTAFASHEIIHTMGILSCELRSVNHRYLEMSLRLPEELRSVENQFRELTNKTIYRGKLDGQIKFRPTQAAAIMLHVNQELAKTLILAGEKLSSIMADAAQMDPLDVLKWPGVINQPDTDFGPLLTATLTLFTQTLDLLIDSREAEGKRIQKLLKQRCKALTQLVKDIRRRRPEVLENIRSKLLKRLNGLELEMDTNRLEQELLLLAQKLDVDEELDRLDSHLTEMNNIFQRDEPVGRRMDFLMQEFNREVNTLGSKSADIETTQATVDMKVLIEQMREQVQNIE